MATALVEGRAGLARLRSRLFRISHPTWRFWAYSLSPLVFLGLAVLVSVWRGAAPARADFWDYSGLRADLSPPLVLLAVVLVNGFGEETGWRGYLLNPLQQRFGALRGALLLGLIWAGWHAPLFWTVETYRAMPVPALLFGFPLGVCAGSIVLARVANRTGGSVLAAALWHSAYNMGSATAASRGSIAAVTTTCVMVWAGLLVFLERRRRASPSLLLANAPSSPGGT